MMPRRGLPYTDADVTVKFNPLSGKEDASGGIVFRFANGKDYLVRANALEDNVRLYDYDRGSRRERIVTARALGSSPRNANSFWTRLQSSAPNSPRWSVSKGRRRPSAPPARQ